MGRGQVPWARPARWWHPGAPGVEGPAPPARRIPGAGAGWRFDPSTYLGAYFEYAPGFVKDCPAGVSCSASDLRLGVIFLYHFAPAAAFDPWAGIGIGYEWLNLGVAGIDVGYHGWEFFNLQLGGDVALGSGFALGPYVAFGLGQYSRVTASLGSQSGSASIPGGSQALHEWLELGVKGTFNP